MPKITIKNSSPLPKNETFQRLQKLFESDPDLRKMDPSYVCEFNLQNGSGSAKGSKFSAQMQIDEQGGTSQVQLNVEIPFLLSPFKGMIQETLEKKLKKAFA